MDGTSIPEAAGRIGFTPPSSEQSDRWHGVELGRSPSDDGDVPIACTLAPEHLAERLGLWQRVLSEARARQEIVGGVRVTLPRTTHVAALGQLIADEQTCCPFFTFTLTITVDEVTLDVIAPPDALPVVHALIGAVA